jgi:hypothetical protein
MQDILGATILYVMALSAAERAHWEVFGFVVLRQLYGPVVVANLTARADELVAADAASRFRRVDGVEYDMQDLAPAARPGDKLDRVRSRERVTLDGVVEREDVVGELLLAESRLWGLVVGLGRIVALYHRSTAQIHVIPYSQIYSVPLFLKRRCDRTLGGRGALWRGLRAGWLRGSHGR